MSGDNDLRYIKVEEALRSAMLQLLETKKLEEVTVSEICKLARCSRNAFYGHYTGRDELCAAMIDDYADTLRKACAEENERLRDGVVGSVDRVKALLSSFQQHEQLLRVLLRSDTGVFSKTLRQTVCDICLESVEELTGQPAEPSVRLAIAYTAGGAVALTDQWFHEDLPFEDFCQAFEAMQVPASEAVRKTASALIHGNGAEEA